MAARGGEISTVAERYAGALFDLAQSQGQADSAEVALDKFQGLLNESGGLRRLVLSPIFSGAEQQKGLEAVCQKTGITGLVRDFLLLLAKNRRLFAVQRASLNRFKAQASKSVAKSRPASLLLRR